MNVALRSLGAMLAPSHSVQDSFAAQQQPDPEILYNQHLRGVPQQKQIETATGRSRTGRLLNLLRKKGDQRPIILNYQL